MINFTKTYNKAQIKKLQIKKIAKNLSLSLGLSLIALTDVFAGYTTVTPNISSNSLTEVMCNVLRIATGNAGKAFAAFAIISVGIGFFTGKVSWGLMVGVAAGIAAMFGAPQIVSAISGKSSADCN